MTHKAVLHDLRVSANPAKVGVLQRYFKTGKGEYAEGDIFWGVTVPTIRTIAKRYKELSLAEVTKLLRSEVHEARLCAVQILVLQYRSQPETIYTLYLNNTRYINNWDLIDGSADRIVGAYIFGKDTSILTQLASSQSVWERRIAIMATYHFIKNGHPEETFRVAGILLHDRHDLIHKAVGWMLREIGQRCSLKYEEAFLEKHAAVMPRTMLRYAIEKFPQQRRQYFLQKAKA